MLSTVPHAYGEFKKCQTLPVNNLTTGAMQPKSRHYLVSSRVCKRVPNRNFQLIWDLTREGRKKERKEGRKKERRKEQASIY